MTAESLAVVPRNATDPPAPLVPGSARLRTFAAVAATACAAGALARFGVSPRGLIAALFLAVLALLSAIDLECHLLPNRIVLPSAAAALLAQVVFYPDRALEWLVAALGAALLMLVLALLRPAGLGMGDVKLMLLLGAALGRSVLPAILAGFVAIWPVALYLLVRHGSAARRRALPLGPALALGAAVMTLAAGAPAT